MALLGDTHRPGGVTFAFTERLGGVSKGCYASLNLGSRCGDEPEAVAANRIRVLKALGADAMASNLVEPRQIHGDHIVVVRANTAAELEVARTEAQAGADAIVCTAPDVPVLLCFADCVPVVLVASGAKPGFAVVHSGWRGTLARIAAKALTALIEETGAEPFEVVAYLGPHILGADYEVSSELLAKFESEFSSSVKASGTEYNLDLSVAIIQALCEAGLNQEHICDCALSTVNNLDRFYSYRAQNGLCGRHGAIAFMPSVNHVGKCS